MFGSVHLVFSRCEFSICEWVNFVLYLVFSISGGGGGDLVFAGVYYHRKVL